jgi:hypothetical protein
MSCKKTSKMREMMTREKRMRTNYDEKEMSLFRF